MSVPAAGQQPASATETDPETLGWMRGFPPGPDRLITFQDGSFRSFPELRWAWSNIRQLVPTVNVWRGAGPASVLPREDSDIGAVTSTTMDGRPMTFANMLEETYTDGIAVLHQGKLIYERYFGALKPHKPHIAMSVTKSFTGVLAGMLVAEGKIDPQGPVTDYVPELKGGAFADARVREVMDMTTGLAYTEIYTDKNSDVWGLRRANGMAPIPPDYEGPTNIFDFLISQAKEGEHGKAFAYKTVNTDVLAWICRRVSGLALSDLLSERIWRPMGAEEDAHYHVDRIGTESGGGGLSTTLPGASYRNQWWVTHNEHGAYMARGVYGQGLYIDPRAEMVIARYAWHPTAGNAANDPVTLPAYMALAKALMAGG